MRKNQLSLSRKRQSRGLGDDIHRVIHKVMPKRFIPRNCNCGKRQEKLNRYPSILNKLVKT